MLPILRYKMSKLLPTLSLLLSLSLSQFQKVIISGIYKPFNKLTRLLNPRWRQQSKEKTKKKWEIMEEKWKNNGEYKETIKSKAMASNIIAIINL